MSRKNQVSSLIFLLALVVFFIFAADKDFKIIRWFKSHSTPAPQDLAALVHGVPITRSQHQRALSERLWLSGKPLTAATPEDQIRALDDLITQELLRAKVRAATPLPTVSKAEIDQRIQRLVGRFETKGALQTAMISQGIPDEAALKNRLSAQIQQEKWLESQIGKIVTPTAEEAQAWYIANQAKLENPARIKARHIFIATLAFPPEDAKKKLEDALAALTSQQKDFANLAQELSDDYANKASGGELGWMTAARLPADLAGPLFSLELRKPTLIQSRLGWHLAEVTERKPAEPRTFEQAQPEILAALSALKRCTAVEELLVSIRKDAAAEITIFPL